MYVIYPYNSWWQGYSSSQTWTKHSDEKYSLSDHRRQRYKGRAEKVAETSTRCEITGHMRRNLWLLSLAVLNFSEKKIKVYLHFSSFLDIETSQGVEIHSRVSK